ncbi:membrane protein YdbS with pleckstrin-like domain [Bacillus sp. RC251]
MNSLHVKIEIGLIIIYVISSCYYMFKFENAKMAYVMFVYLGISLTLRAWMEWKYDRKSKEYILSITGMVTCILMLSILVYFVPPAA